MQQLQQEAKKERNGEKKSDSKNKKEVGRQDQKFPTRSDFGDNEIGNGLIVSVSFI